MKEKQKNLPWEYTESKTFLKAINTSYPGGRTPYESLDAICEQNYAGKGS